MKWVFLKLLIHSVSLPPCSSWKTGSQNYTLQAADWKDLWRTWLLLLLSRFSHVWLCTTQWEPIRLHRPWDSPDKNTGVGGHFLLQCMKVKSESEVTQSCPTLHDPMDCSLPGSSVHEIFQARVPEWVAIAFWEPSSSHNKATLPDEFLKNSSACMLRYRLC